MVYFMCHRGHLTAFFRGKLPPIFRPEQRHPEDRVAYRTFGVLFMCLALLCPYIWFDVGKPCIPWGILTVGACFTLSTAVMAIALFGMAHLEPKAVVVEANVN